VDPLMAWHTLTAFSMAPFVMTDRVVMSLLNR
jgi:hypothetical protein